MVTTKTETHPTNLRIAPQSRSGSPASRSGSPTTRNGRPIAGRSVMNGEDSASSNLPTGKKKSHTREKKQYWCFSEIDISRDRNAKTVKVAKKNLGGARQHMRDLKSDRLEFQDGDEELWLNMLQKISSFFREQSQNLGKLEALFYLLLGLKNATKKAHVALAIMNFLKSYETDLSLIKLGKDFSEVSQFLLQDGDEDKAADILGLLRDMMNKWPRFRKTSLVKKMGKVHACPGLLYSF